MDLIQNPQPRTDVFGTGTVTNKSTIVILKVQPPLTRSKDKRVEEEKESSTPNFHTSPSKYEKDQLSVLLGSRPIDLYHISL